MTCPVMMKVGAGAQKNSSAGAEHSDAQFITYVVAVFNQSVIPPLDVHYATKR